MANKSKSLSKGGFYYLIYNVLNMAFPFITGIYVARKLLPEYIGMVSAAQNLSQYFVILAFLGIPTYGLREIAKVRDDENERNKVYSELYVINFISTCVFFLLYLILIFNVSRYKKDISLYLITGISIVLNAFNISWLYEGLEEFKFISLRNIAFKIICFILLVLLVRNQEDYLIYACITVVGTAGNYFVNMAYSRRYIKFVRSNLCLKRHLKSIMYLVAVNLAIEIYSLIDITMMNFWCPKESIAYYKYGHSILKILLQIVNTFTMVLIPRISYYYKEGRLTDFNKLISKALKLIIIVACPMIIGLLYTSDFLIVQLYGATYINSALVLKLFSALLIISPIGYLLGSRVLLVTGNENKMIISVGIGAIVNCIGNAVLIPVYEEFGATIASIISEVVVMIIYVSMGKRYFHLIDIASTITKVCFASLAEVLFLFVIASVLKNGWLCLIIQVMGAIILYFGVLCIEKENTVISYVSIFLNKILVRQK